MINIIKWFKRKRTKIEIDNNLKDIKTTLLKEIRDTHQANRGTFNYYRQLSNKYINLMQVVVADGKNISQHLVKIYIGGCKLLCADYTNINSPLFYDVEDGELIKSENQNINYYIEQI